MGDRLRGAVDTLVERFGKACLYDVRGNGQAFIGEGFFVRYAPDEHVATVAAVRAPEATELTLSGASRGRGVRL